MIGNLKTALLGGLVICALAAAPASAETSSPTVKAALTWAAKHRPPGIHGEFQATAASCYQAGKGTALCRIVFVGYGKYGCEKDIFVSTVTYQVERVLGSG